MVEILPHKFYNRSTISVAKELLGKVLVHQTKEGKISGKIVETEAYMGEKDLASHTSKGKTKRTQIMYGPPGFAYIYFTYGMHWMLNVVTEKEGKPQAVLIRAVEPLDGIDLMLKNRNKQKLSTDLTSGPAKLTKAFAIDGKLNGINLTKPPLYIVNQNIKIKEIKTSKRVGVDYAKHYKDKPWRFFVKDNPYVSKP